MKIHYFLISEYGVGKWAEGILAESETSARTILRLSRVTGNLTYLGEFENHKEFTEEYGEEV